MRKTIGVLIIVNSYVDIENEYQSRPIDCVCIYILTVCLSFGWINKKY